MEMNTIRRLFVCCTPFQIFNCIGYIINDDKKCECDIAICNHFINARKIFENCKNSKLWRNCFFLRTEYNRSAYETLKIINEINFEKMNDSNDNFSWDYDEIYIGTVNNISSIICLKYCRKFKKRLYIFDEGVGSYLFNSMEKEFPKNQRLLRTLLGHVIYPKDIDMLLLCKPKLYSGSFKATIDSLYKNEVRTSRFRAAINNIFEYKNNDYSEVIFFEQPDSIVSFAEKGKKNNELLNAIISGIEEITMDYSIKWHPRTTDNIKNRYGTNAKRIKSSLGGWEVDLLNRDTNYRFIFVSVSSSASILSNILFGDSDVVIFLYKLAELETNHLQIEGIDKLVRKLKDNGAKIYLPESIGEFSAVLKKLLE